MGKNAMGKLEIFPLEGLPEVVPGDDLGAALAEAMRRAGLTPQPHDVLVVAQKVVSKAEGARVRLSSITPSQRARDWAARWERDPRLVELVLRESRRIVRMERGLIIGETHHGFICANAGIDLSNTGDPGGEIAVLLPEDPDRSAAMLRGALCTAFDLPPGETALGVIVADSFGRPWRVGLTQVALGVAGLPALDDYRHGPDAGGRELHATVIAIADELACAADLVCGKTMGVPAALVRGFRPVRGQPPELPTGGRALIREAEMDLFRE